jgi:hypothetical protein
VQEPEPGTLKKRASPAPVVAVRGEKRGEKTGSLLPCCYSDQREEPEPVEAPPKGSICELRNKIKRHSSHASNNIYTRPGRPGDRYQNQTTITAASSRALVCWRGGAAWQDASDTMHAVVGSQVKILNVTCCTVARDQIDNNNTSSRGLTGWAFLFRTR